jgi:hypothetical protein
MKQNNHIEGNEKIIINNHYLFTNFISDTPIAAKRLFIYLFIYLAAL